MNPKIQITRRTLLIYLLILIITLIMPFSLSCGCESFYGEGRLLDLLIENKTDNKLLIFIGDYEEGYVSPNETITKRFVDYGEFIIRAKNIQGDIVFSKTYTLKSLIKINSDVYKVVISSTKENSENVTRY